MGLEFEIRPSCECWLFHELGEGDTFIEWSRFRGDGWFMRFPAYERAGTEGLLDE
jgi:hypothetical protein